MNGELCAVSYEFYKEKKIIKNKKFLFCYKDCKTFLREKQNKYILIKQVLRSGTRKGALVRESEILISQL